LFLGDILLDSFSSGSITSGEVKHDILSGMIDLALGDHTLEIRIARSFTTSGNTPDQYVDDVVVTGPAVSQVPLPAGMPLLLGALGLLGYMRKRAT
jgi:hypothetical protein